MALWHGTVALGGRVYDGIDLAVFLGYSRGYNIIAVYILKARNSLVHCSASRSHLRNGDREVGPRAKKVNRITSSVKAFREIGDEFMAFY
jgi:hypothetical protein